MGDLLPEVPMRDKFENAVAVAHIGHTAHLVGGFLSGWLCKLTSICVCSSPIAVVAVGLVGLFVLGAALTPLLA